MAMMHHTRGWMVEEDAVACMVEEDAVACMAEEDAVACTLQRSCTLPIQVEDHEKQGTPKRKEGTRDRTSR